MYLTSSIKKTLTMLILFIMTFVSFTMVTTVKAHATTSSDISDVKVTFDATSGKMIVNGGGISNTTTSAKSWEGFIAKYRGFIIGISAIGMVSMILFFVFSFMKLAGTAGNPRARQEVLNGLIWSGVAAAGLGSVTTFVGFFYGALK